MAGTYFTSNPVSAPAGPYATATTTSEIQLGAKFVDQNGNAYRYALNGAVAAVPGKLYQAPAEVTADQNLAVSAAAIGATTVTTTTTVTVTANQYAGGYLIVTVTPGEGYRYLISSHPAATAAAVTLTLADPIQVALTTSSRIDLVANPYNGVIINPTTASSGAVGVCVDATAASSYFWLQTGGVAALLMDAGTGVVGTFQCASNGTAGAIEPFTGVQAPVGIAMTGIAATEYGAVKLFFDVG